MLGNGDSCINIMSCNNLNDAVTHNIQSFSFEELHSKNSTTIMDDCSVRMSFLEKLLTNEEGKRNGNMQSKMSGEMVLICLFSKIIIGPTSIRHNIGTSGNGDK